MNSSVFLDPSDFVGITFWIISAAMIASTFFFYMERDRAVGQWKTSLSVAALVTGIAAIHYMYMRGVWVNTQASPIVLRYVDWILTVPLQIIEFYLILSAITRVRASLFWRLLVASLIMLVSGYIGEINASQPSVVWYGYTIGMIAWLYIIYEIFFGQAANLNQQYGTHASRTAFNAMRWIVTIGWAIYPLGYLYGYVGTGNVNLLNIIYNLADFINKIAFGLVIWSAATSEESTIGKTH